MHSVLYSLALLSLAAAFSFATGPLRWLVVLAFVLHLLAGLLRAVRLGRWWSLFHVLGYYLFLALLFPKVIAIVRGLETGLVWNTALGLVCVANLGLWVAARTKGVSVPIGYPAGARLPEYWSFSWLDEVSA